MPDICAWLLQDATCCALFLAAAFSEEGAVIRPFGLTDVLAVRRLQRTGAWLDLFHYLLLRRSALTTAMIAPVPWVGTGLASYVWQSQQGIQGFVQMLKRPGRYEADLLFIAPDIQQSPGEAAWEHLLAYCIEDAGRHGMRRLFASLPEGTAESDVLSALGFAIYSNEDVFVVRRPPKAAPAPQDGRLRLRREDDIWWLRRLYSIYAPQPVQHAEGMSDGEGPLVLPLAWWELTHQHGYVVANGNDIYGGVQLVSGRCGHWLLVHGDPADQELMALLIQQGLHEMAGNRWPVFCAVRDYQGGMRAVLYDHGFEPYTRRSRLVKHLAVRVKATEPAPVSAMVVERPG